MGVSMCVTDRERRESWGERERGRGCVCVALCVSDKEREERGRERREKRENEMMASCAGGGR